jgi:hypothetical protein
MTVNSTDLDLKSTVRDLNWASAVVSLSARGPHWILSFVYRIEHWCGVVWVWVIILVRKKHYHYRCRAVWEMLKSLWIPICRMYSHQKEDVSHKPQNPCSILIFLFTVWVYVGACILQSPTLFIYVFREKGLIAVHFIILSTIINPFQCTSFT